MAFFEYEAFDKKTEKTKRGIIEAKSEAEAINTLQALILENLIPSRIRKISRREAHMEKRIGRLQGLRAELEGHTGSQDNQVSQLSTPILKTRRWPVYVAILIVLSLLIIYAAGTAH